MEVGECRQAEFERRGMDDMWCSKAPTSCSPMETSDSICSRSRLTHPRTLTDDAMKGGIDLGTSPDGHSIKGDALGHLDISWRMSLGEPGRLQTSSSSDVVSPLLPSPSPPRPPQASNSIHDCARG